MTKMSAKELADAITSYLNTFQDTEQAQKLVEMMEVEHRTLQQTFTKFVCMWLEHAASEDYRFDDRNKASHKVAKDMINGFAIVKEGIKAPPSKWLPMI